MSVWIIVENYEPEHIEETLTNILPYYYEDERDAFTALYDIAKDLMVDMSWGERKFLAPPERGIYRDTYEIMELNRA